jgi:hypothetical protein
MNFHMLYIWEKPKSVYDLIGRAHEYLKFNMVS